MYQVDQYTVSLLHFDDGIIDETGKVWTAVGGAEISETQAKFGESSLYLNNTPSDQSKYIYTSNSADFDFGAGDFTIDFWYYPLSFESNWGNSSVPSQQWLATHWGSEGEYGWLLATTKVDDNKAALVFAVSTTGVNQIITVSQSNNCYVSLNQWQHICICRESGTLRLFVDGVLKHSTADANNYYFNQQTLCLGRTFNSIVTSGGPNAYFDEFRISKGIARWTSDFTPPSQPDVSDAILRITMNDSSEREYQLTATETDNFINWFNHHANTDTASFMFNKTVGVQSRKEYLAYDKIISFEVIPVA